MVECRGEAMRWERGIVATHGGPCLGVVSQLPDAPQAMVRTSIRGALPLLPTLERTRSLD